MAVRKTSRPSVTGARGKARKHQPDSAMRQVSAIVGAALIGAALLWFAWMLVRQLNPGAASITFPFSGPMAQNSTQAPADPLVAAGITLTTPGQEQTPRLSKQQALLLAGQIESQVAERASGVSVEYILLSYTAHNSNFHDVPAWLVHYTGVVEPGADANADPHATNTPHDLYVFLDAQSGQELLAIWL